MEARLTHQRQRYIERLSIRGSLSVVELILRRWLEK